MDQPTTAPAPASPTVYEILGREVRLPVEVRDATAAVAYYVVPARAAQRLVDPTGLRVARVLPGRTLVTIGAMEYIDGDLGQYREIAVTFFVHEPGARPLPLVGGMLELLRGTLSAYIHQLPVDGEFTCEAGRAIWGFPKFVTEIDLSTSENAQTAVLRADGRHVLTQTVRRGGKRRLADRPQVSYALREGVLYRTPSVMAAEGMGVRFGGDKLELGDHPIAEELRMLGLPRKPLFTTYLGRMTGRFFAAERRPAPASDAG
ncbi:MAG: acetoacetate decarboxylase family protein [Dehalococcoidia bacterium]